MMPARLSSNDRLTIGPRFIGSGDIDLYEAWNKPDEAEKWRTKLTKIEAVTE
jgi:hypothetical protein